MSQLPDPQSLADLVSAVTDTMFGIRFRVTDDLQATLPWDEPQAWRTFSIPLRGPRPLTVAISTNAQGSRHLGGVMFSCGADQVDAKMGDDALAELLNIVAGQVKVSLNLDQEIGLPGPFAAAPTDDEFWRIVWLRGSKHDLRIWIGVAET